MRSDKITNPPCNPLYYRFFNVSVGGQLELQHVFSASGHSAPQRHLWTTQHPPEILFLIRLSEKSDALMYEGRQLLGTFSCPLLSKSDSPKALSSYYSGRTDTSLWRCSHILITGALPLRGSGYSSIAYGPNQYSESKRHSSDTEED